MSKLTFTQGITHAISYANFKAINPNQQPSFSWPPYPVQSTGAEGGDISSRSTMSSQSATTEPVFLGNNEASRLIEVRTFLLRLLSSPRLFHLTFFLYQINSAINLFWVYHPNDLLRIGFIPSAKTVIRRRKETIVSQIGDISFSLIGIH